MDLKIGTFNLNNLFSRFNFQASISQLAKPNQNGGVEYLFKNENEFEIRTNEGRLVKEKPAAERATLAARILAMELDVLAVQEVENIQVLEQFAREELGNRFPYQVLVEGNDRRLIDVGLLSRYPIGGVVSWRFARHHANPGSNVFSRDMAQVEILDAARKKRLVTIFNHHLKSHFCSFREDPVECAKQNNTRRHQQAEAAAQIIAAQTRPDGRFVVVGDLNDGPESEFLAPMLGNPHLKMVNALQNARESQPYSGGDAPASPVWTHRFKESGKPARFELFDQIWVSPALANRVSDAVIQRRKKVGGDASDHDPAFIRLILA